jgi:hypothetical protein
LYGRQRRVVCGDWGIVDSVSSGEGGIGAAKGALCRAGHWRESLAWGTSGRGDVGRIRVREPRADSVGDVATGKSLDNGLSVAGACGFVPGRNTVGSDCVVMSSETCAGRAPCQQQTPHGGQNPVSRSAPEQGDPQQNSAEPLRR